METKDHLSYPLPSCFTGETKVYTDEFGCVPMSTIVGKRVTVLNGDYKRSRVAFKSYGIQNVWDLTLTRGDVFEIVFKVTPDHEWVLVDGSRVKTRNLRREELRSIHGDKWVVKESVPTDEYVEVFCCEEPDTHSFILYGGLLTGNCTHGDNR